MPTPIFAGTWHIQTNAKLRTDDVTGLMTFNDKLTTMSAVITDFYSQANQYAKVASAGTAGGSRKAVTTTAPATPLYIFIAPEYYFKKTIGERCVTKVERDQFIATMSQLAANKPHLLLVPGTITWKKDATDTKTRKKAQTRLVERQYKFTDGAFAEKKRQQLQFVGDVKFVAYNTAYLFYGTGTFKYHKMNDVGELQAGDTDTLFIPGSIRGNYTIAGLQLGIEICGDHDVGMLNQPVDIHIVTSASVGRKNEKVWAKNGGMFLHASNEGSEAWKVTRPGGTTPLQLSELASMSNQPQLGTEHQMQFEIQSRLQDLRNRGVPESAVQQSTEKFTKQVRQAFGGTLTTWMGMLDTV